MRTLGCRTEHPQTFPYAQSSLLGHLPRHHPLHPCLDIHLLDLCHHEPHHRFHSDPQSRLTLALIIHLRQKFPSKITWAEHKGTIACLTVHPMPTLPLLLHNLSVERTRYDRITNRLPLEMHPTRTQHDPLATSLPSRLTTSSMLRHAKTLLLQTIPQSRTPHVPISRWRRSP